MARVLSAKQKDELAALLKLSKRNKEQQARLEQIAPEACAGCVKKKTTTIKKSEVRDG